MIFFRKNLFILVLFFSGFIVNKYVITINKVEGQSMVPTLSDRSFVVSLMAPVLKLANKNHVRGGIFIIKPNDFESRLVKRLIALPGEQIWIENGIVFVNDKNMTTELQLTLPKAADALSCKYFSTYTVPDKHYFFVGDNLCMASDSRNIGAIREEDILGKVIFHFSL